MNGFCSEQSRRCPLCSQSIGGYMIHGIRSRYDFRKHYLAPLRTSPAAERQPPRLPQTESSTRRYRSARERERDRRVREEREETDKLQRSIEKRRLIYEHDLYAKVRLCLWNHLPHDPMPHSDHRVDDIIMIGNQFPGVVRLTERFFLVLLFS